MSLLLEVPAFLALALGGLVTVTGGIGLLRFPGFFTRLHAASLTDTLGAALIVLGLVLMAPGPMVVIKLVLVLVFVLFTGPVATHALAKAALHGRLRPVVAPGAPEHQEAGSAEYRTEYHAPEAGPGASTGPGEADR